MLTRIDHVGIACRDLEETIAFYRSTFGLSVVSIEANEEQGVREAMLRLPASGPGEAAGLAMGAGSAEAVSPGGGAGRSAGSGTLAGTGAPAGDPEPAAAAMPMGACYIQLLEPTRPDSPVGKFLDRRGQGIHHVGYGVTDIAGALAEIGSRGIRLIDERPRHGSMGASIAFLHPGDLGGVLTELVQAP